MINSIEHIINIDFANKINMNKAINIKRNDTKSHKFILNIFNRGMTYNLTSTTAKIYFKKLDTEKVFDDCILDDAINGKMSCILSTQTVSCSGTVETEITIYGTSGEILTSVTFNFTVDDVVRDDNAIESTSEFTALTNALMVIASIDNKLDKTDFTTFKDSTESSLAENANQTLGYISLKNYCVGDGITDDTIGFNTALAYAITNKLGIYVPGSYLIKQKIVIPDQTIPIIWGANRSKCFLEMDIDSGYAIEVQSYSAQALIIKNLSIESHDVTKKISGIKVNNNNLWGGGCVCENVSLYNFTDVVLDIVEGYSCHFKNCNFIGGKQNDTNVATLLKIEKVINFSNINTFENCTFQFGKIGIDNLAGTGYKFISCDFESLTLFMHMPLFVGYDSKMNFDNCWFEKITKGIINADMDYAILTPITPVTNKSNIGYLKFINCYTSGTLPSYVLDVIVEPINYLIFNFAFGLTMTQQGWETIALQNGWTGTLKVLFNPTLNQVAVQGVLTVGTITEGTIIASLNPSYNTKPSLAHVPVIAYSGTTGKLFMNFIITTGANLMLRTNGTLPFVVGDQLYINTMYQI